MAATCTCTTTAAAPTPVATTMAATTTAPTTPASTTPQMTLTTATTTTTLGETITCVVWGDPHVVTFDLVRRLGLDWVEGIVDEVHSGRRQLGDNSVFPDFLRVGDYWMVKSERISIQGQYRTGGGWALHGIAVGGPFLEGHVLSLERLWAGEGDIFWDGQPVADRARFSAPGLVSVRTTRGRTRDRRGDFLGAEVELPDGVRVRIKRFSWSSGGRSGASVECALTMRRQAGGQDGHCGKADGDLSDDNQEYMYNQGMEVPPPELMFSAAAPPALLQDVSPLPARCAQDLPAADEAVCAAAFERANLSAALVAPFMRACTMDVCNAQNAEAASASVSAAVDASSVTSPIRWAREPDWCVEVGGGKPEKGSGVQLWPCGQSKANAQFLLPPGGRGLVRWAAHPDMCLDVHPRGGRVGNGVRIQLWACREGHPNMQFVLPKGGRGKIRWAEDPSMCLDVKHGREVRGTPVQLWRCGEAPQANKDFAIGGLER